MITKLIKIVEYRGNCLQRFCFFLIIPCISIYGYQRADEDQKGVADLRYASSAMTGSEGGCGSSLRFVRNDRITRGLRIFASLRPQ